MFYDTLFCGTEVVEVMSRISVVSIAGLYLVVTSFCLWAAV